MLRSRRACPLLLFALVVSINTLREHDWQVPHAVCETPLRWSRDTSLPFAVEGVSMTPASL